MTSNLEETRVDVNNHLESHEQISNLYIARDEWTSGNGLLTPTLKLKRSDIEARYLSALADGFGEAILWEEAGEI